MSFILDALRKSDAERQRTAAPGLTDVRYAAREERRSIWLPILVLVLAANMLFMGYQWYARTGAAVPAAAVAEPPPAAPAQATPPAAAPPADIRPLAREVDYGDAPLEPELEEGLPGAPVALPVIAEGREGGPAEPRPAAPVPPPASAPGAAAPRPATPSRILPGNDLPTAEQLMGSGALNTPMLNLDLHVYSSKPTDRFVVINSRKYKEGSQLNEGPTVESITSDGVILASNGRRFTLSRK
ncbi:MAG: general secretion pathway protein GspB [Gammaproteobacteria bacterium]